MTLIIYHGDNKVLLNQKVSELKGHFTATAISQFSLKSQSFEQIIVNLSTVSFFADTRLAIIEDGDDKKVKIADLPDDPDLTVVIIFGKELSAHSSLIQDAALRKAQIVSFGQPQDKTIFQFLDLLAEKDRKALRYFEKLFDDFGGQYLLTMLIFLVRRLVLPISGMPDFIARKTKKQQQNFLPQEVIGLYHKILESEFKIKTGQAEERTEILLLLNTILR